MEYYEYIEREAEDERRERRQVQRERFLPYGFREPTKTLEGLNPEKIQKAFAEKALLDELTN